MKTAMYAIIKKDFRGVASSASGRVRGSAPSPLLM